MASRRGFFLLSLLAVLAFTPALEARESGPQGAIRPFPLIVQGEVSSTRIELQPLQNEMAALLGLARVTLTGVPLPGAEMVELVLEQIPVLVPEGGIHRNGRQDPATLEDLDLGVWKGHVAGNPQSEVLLAFSSHGSWGWIRTDRLFHLASRPDAAGEWDAFTAVLVTESALPEPQDGAPFLCHTTEIEQPRLPEVLERVSGDGIPSPLSQRGGGPPLPLYQLRVAVETDNQYFDLFGSFIPARNYALSLLSAVSDRYREQIGTILTYPYLAIYDSQLADPWDTQDQGGGSVDLLYEFSNAWGSGSAPVVADLYHFMSGASLGGGVAWLDTICDDDFGFAVSGNIGGNTPVPIEPNHAFNWDFVVIAHELGHNVATPHTHNYCPPLDECAPSGYWGSCQDEVACISTGTIMSYCHLCPGGMQNVTSFFHPDVVDVMRNGIETSCLQVFQGVITRNIGYSLTGSNGAPRMTISLEPDPATFIIDVVRAPTNVRGMFIASFRDPIFRPYRGGTQVPRFDFSREFRTRASGTVFIDKDISHLSFPTGAEVVSQMWFVDPTGPSGFAASNAVRFEIILP